MIVNGVASANLLDGETVIIRVSEATILEEKVNTTLSKLYLHKSLVDIDDRPRLHGEKLFLEKEGIIVIITLTGGMMILNISNP